MAAPTIAEHRHDRVGAAFVRFDEALDRREAYVRQVHGPDQIAAGRTAEGFQRFLNEAIGPPSRRFRR